MDSAIKALYRQHQDALMGQIAERYAVAPGAIAHFGGFESEVYTFTFADQPAVLKIIHQSHRSYDELRSETDWLNYLAGHGVPVARALPSAGGALVERVETGETAFFAIAYARAPGDWPHGDGWNPDFFRAYGDLLGRIHALTRQYSRPAFFNRRAWYEDRFYAAPETLLPPDQPRVLERAEALVQRLRALPAGPDTFGLVHADAHYGNMNVHNGQITLFDFDDSRLDWYANDIAIALFYALSHPDSGPDQPAFARRFLMTFLEAYRRHQALTSEWLAHLPDFLKLRELDLYILIYLEDLHEQSDWVRSFMAGRRQRIEQDIPVVELDFTTL